MSLKSVGLTRGARKRPLEPEGIDEVVSPRDQLYARQEALRIALMYRFLGFGVHTGK